MSQKQTVLNYIRENGSITRMQSAQIYIFELSSRIGELKTQGDDEGNRWLFKKTPLKGQRPDGSRWRVIRYSDPMRIGFDAGQV